MLLGGLPRQRWSIHDVELLNRLHLHQQSLDALVIGARNLWDHAQPAFVLKSLLQLCQVESALHPRHNGAVLTLPDDLFSLFVLETSRLLP
jgi:hypothetical protein